MTSHISGLELVLQRYAREDEMEKYNHMLMMWEAMGEEERRRRGLERVTDLARPESPLRDAVRYIGDKLMINERYAENVNIPVGVPGAREALKRLVARMLSRYTTADHVSFYVIAEFSDEKGRSKGFRTVVARHAI